MRRLSDIVGRPIISNDTGRRLGHVSDLLLDANSGRALAVLVSSGWRHSEQVLPFFDFQIVGTGAVMARSRSALITLRQWREGDAATVTVRSRTVNGKPVVTFSGKRLGAIEDLLVDEDSGDMHVVEIAAWEGGGMLGRRALLPVSAGLTIGGDVVVVSDALAEQLCGPDANRS